MLPSCSSTSLEFSPFPGMLLEEAGWRAARSPPHITMQNAQHPQPREGDAAPCKDVGLGPPRQHKTWISRPCALSPLSEKFQCLEESGRAFVCKFPTGQMYKPQIEWLSHTRAAVNLRLHRITAVVLELSNTTDGVTKREDQ